MKKIGFLFLLVAGCGGRTIFAPDAGKPPADVVPVEDGHSSATMAIHAVPAIAYNVDLGKGINTLTGITSTMNDKARCIIPGPITTMADSAGSSMKMNLETISTTEDFFNKLSVDFAASFGMGSDAMGILAANGSVGVKYLSEIRIKSDHSYMLITAEKTYVPKNITQYKMAPEVLANFNKYPENFIRDCGDAFISSVAMGAKINALLDCTVDSVQDKMAVDAAISASVQTFTMAGEASLTTSLEKIANTSKNKCRIVIESFGGDGPVPTGINDFLEKTTAYINASNINLAKPVGVGTLPYDVLVDQVEVSDLLAKIRETSNVTASLVKLNKLAINSFLAQLSGFEWLYFSHRNDSEWLLKNGSDVQSKMKTAAQKISDLSAKTFKCSNDYGNKKSCIDSDIPGGDWE